MVNFLGSLFNKTTESVLGIDIGSSSIKLIQLKKKGGKAILETYGELALGPYAGVEVGRATNLPYEKISEALSDLLREAATTTRKSGLAIPFGASLMALMEMPAVEQKQLAQMIPIEARKYIPVPLSEVMLDWWVIPKPDTRDMEPDEGESKLPQLEKVDVLAVAIHNDAINKYQQIVQKVELEASFFEIEIFSTIRSVLDQDIAPVMIFDLGAALTKLYVVERGIVKNSHTVNRGSQDLTLTISKSFNITMANAEIMKRNYGTHTGAQDKDIADLVALSTEYIFDEANRVIMGYQKKYNKNIGRVVLVGGGVKIHDFLNLAKENLETEVILGNPFSKIEVPAVMEDMLKRTGPEFSVAAGIALRKLHELG